MKKEKPTDAISAFLGSETRIEGKLEFRGTIRLDGNVEGQIKSRTGTLIIGDKANIKAQIQVDSVIVRGKVEGGIEARKRIEAYPPARISGDIQAPEISIESGVAFNGNCTMKSRAEVKPKDG
jgi:cytoskeletal protein CcmA (bactofilin family)